MHMMRKPVATGNGPEGTRPGSKAALASSDAHGNSAEAAVLRQGMFMRPKPRSIRWVAPCALAVFAALSGCERSGLPESPTAVPGESGGESGAQSVESMALQSYYLRAQTELLTQGLLRTDGGGPDVPYSARDLVENFIRIALFNEYQRDESGRFIEREAESVLHRWERPVRFALHFGQSVPGARRVAIERLVERYARQLAGASGHPVSLAGTGGNFHILILGEDERRSFRDRLSAIDPDLDGSAKDAILRLRRSIFCGVVTISGRVAPNTYDVAFAIIRAEHPEPLMTQCIHEELAQGLGLPNDSRRARPSIFNDNEEFGLLTRHDELLLKMLYDPRLRPGMTAREARPILEQLARDLLPDEI